MNRQILQKLSQKDLQNYRNTLKKRVEQLKSFNNEIAHDNSRIIAKLNKIAEQQQNQRLLHKKKVNKSNFDFDDLYRMGVNKVGKIVNKDGLKNLYSVGEQKIKKGFGFAQNIVKKYMGKTKPENQTDNPNIDNKVRIINEEQNLNEHADFNSYDVGNGRHFQHYEPKAQQNLQVPSPTLQQKPVESSTQKKPIQRKKIFDREQQQQILAHKKMIREKTPQSSSESEGEAKLSKNVNKSPTQPQQPTQADKIEKVEQADQKMKNQIKQVLVEPNKVVDLEVDEDEQQKYKRSPAKSQQKSPQKNQQDKQPHVDKNDENSSK